MDSIPGQGVWIPQAEMQPKKKKSEEELVEFGDNRKIKKDKEDSSIFFMF